MRGQAGAGLALRSAGGGSGPPRSSANMTNGAAIDALWQAYAAAWPPELVAVWVALTLNTASGSC